MKCICEKPLPEECPECGELPCVCRKGKVKIKLSDGKVRELQSMSATSFWDADGKPITAAQFLENLYGKLPDFFKNEDELRAIWSRPDTRKELLERLSDEGFGGGLIAEIKKIIGAKDSDVYDVLAYVAFATEAISREERVQTHRPLILSHYDPNQQEFIEFILAQYVRSGVTELDQDKLPILAGMKYGSVNDAVRVMGGPDKIRETFVGFQEYLYQQVEVK